MCRALPRVPTHPLSQPARPGPRPVCLAGPPGLSLEGLHPVRLVGGRVLVRIVAPLGDLVLFQAGSPLPVPDSLALSLVDPCAPEDSFPSSSSSLLTEAILGQYPSRPGHGFGICPLWPWRPLGVPVRRPKTRRAPS